jgi:hypothetical protein
MPSIPLKPGSNRQVVITDNMLAFKNWKVLLDDVTGLSFGLYSLPGSLSNSGAYIYVRAASSVHKIATKNFGVFGYLEGKDNMQEIIDAIRQAVAPCLLRSFSTYIFDRRIPVDIGRFTLSSVGLSYKGLTGTTCVAWKFKPTCRTTSKIRWLTGGTAYGVQEVSYFNPQTGRDVVLGTVSSS